MKMNEEEVRQWRDKFNRIGDRLKLRLVVSTDRDEYYSNNIHMVTILHKSGSIWIRGEAGEIEGFRQSKSNTKFLVGSLKTLRKAEVADAVLATLLKTIKGGVNAAKVPK